MVRRIYGIDGSIRPLTPVHEQVTCGTRGKGVGVTGSGVSVGVGVIGSGMSVGVGGISVSKISVGLTSVAMGVADGTGVLYWQSTPTIVAARRHFEPSDSQMA